MIVKQIPLPSRSGMEAIQPEGYFVETVVDWHGQPFQLLRSEHTTRQDGRPTTILVWQANCRTCGTVFTTTTSVRRLKYPTRNCPAHRRTDTAKNEGNQP